MVIVGGSAASLWGREKSVVIVNTAEVRGIVEKRGSILKEVKSEQEQPVGPVSSPGPSTSVLGICDPGGSLSL